MLVPGGLIKNTLPQWTQRRAKWMKKVGLIVNPIAGIGGKIGLKGSDDLKLKDLIDFENQRSLSAERAEIALSEAHNNCGDLIEFIVAPGEMGEAIIKNTGFKYEVIGSIMSGNTTATDTEEIAKNMLSKSIDLLVFVGGDGTARNICNAVGSALPVLGLPAGVKMHSSVFATTPKTAAAILWKFAKGNLVFRDREVLDIDEEGYRQGRVVSKLYGYLNVPTDSSLIQGGKVGGINQEGSFLKGIAEVITEIINRDSNYIYILGPGSTTKAILDNLNIEGTLLGVDVVYKSKLIAKDVNEKSLIDLVKEFPAKIIVTPIGGQGYIFGRGNQQISGEILSRVGSKNIIIVATLEKLASIPERKLLVDTGSLEIDGILHGVYRVISGYGLETVLRVE